MITVVPRLDRHFKIVGIEVNGKFHRASFTIDYAAQSTSWLIYMHLEYNGQTYRSPVYSVSPLITDDLMAVMCRDMQNALNDLHPESEANI